MIYLLIGGAGYLGSRLARELKSQGNQVIIADLREEGSLGPGIEYDRYLQVDAKADYQDFRALVNECGCIFNLAGIRQNEAEEKPLEAIQGAMANNWEWLSLIDKAEKGPAYILISSIHVYGAMAGCLDENTIPRPASVYGMSKLVSEQAVGYFRRRYGLRAVSVRLANSFGAPVSIQACDWTTVINDFCSQAVATQCIRLNTPGLQRRNFVPLDDSVRALRLVSEISLRWPQEGFILIGGRYNTRIMDMALKVAGRYMLGTGQKVEVIAPEPQASDLRSAADFTFDVQRLEDWGFEWHDRVDEEIDDTIQILLKARQ